MMAPILVPPKDDFDARRWKHTAMRRRMLNGTWARDLDEEMALHLRAARREQWGVPDKSSNVFKSATWQLGVLYDRWPMVTHDDASADPLISRGGALDQSGLWPLMSRHQKMVIGCREYLMHVHATEAGGLLYRPVVPDRVVAKAHPDQPDVPVFVREARLRTIDGKELWTYDEADIRNPENPTFRVFKMGADGEPTEDITERTSLRRVVSGEAYPYRKSDGTPILPYIMHHAERTGGLWDPWEGLEVVQGSLTAAVMWSFVVHCTRDASWPQRVAVGAVPVGAAVQDAGERGTRAVIETDPTMILLFDKLPDFDGQPLLEQWGAAADIEKLQAAVSQFEARLAQFAGVNPADIQRVGGDPRSGYAIAISRQGQRDAQRKFEPQFRRADLQLIELSAVVSNRILGTSYPEDGYRIRYESVPLSADERDALRRDVVERVNAGLLSPVSAYMELNPGTSEGDAEKELDEIFSSRSRFGMAQDTTASEPDQPPVQSVTDATAPVVDKAQDTALNGAQVQAAQGIIESVATGRLPRKTGVAMLSEFFNIDAGRAERIMGAVGSSFQVVEPTQTRGE